MKEIDLTKSVYDLTEQYPELIPILKELGFWGVVSQVTRNTVGRVMTIPQGCQKMGKNLDEVICVLKDQGFEIRSS